MKFDFSQEKERIRFYKQSFWKGVNGVRRKVLERDNYECQMCKEKGLVVTEKLHVHHLKELEYCNMEEALAMSNVVCVCRDCHDSIHNRFGGRKIKYNKYVEDERW